MIISLTVHSHERRNRCSSAGPGSTGVGGYCLQPRRSTCSEANWHPERFSNTNYLCNRCPCRDALPKLQMVTFHRAPVPLSQKGCWRMAIPCRGRSRESEIRASNTHGIQMAENAGAGREADDAQNSPERRHFVDEGVSGDELPEDA